MLKYIGAGAYLPGIPARDLTADEVEAIGLTVAELVGSGLYAEPPSNSPRAKKRTGGESKEKDEAVKHGE